MEHCFVAVDLVRVQARVVATEEGEDVQYTAECGTSQTEVMCEICQAPATVEIVRGACPGPSIPDDPSSLEQP